MSSMQRTGLTAALLRQLRAITAGSVIFSKVVAERVGHHPTDLECLDYVLLHGASTAGQLAAVTGLTTGAVTAVIDRLEQAGYVQRARDTDDRRKVLVVPNVPKIHAEIAPLSQSMGTAIEALAQDFSDDELEVIVRFLTQANEIAVGEIAKVAAGSSQ